LKRDRQGTSAILGELFVFLLVTATVHRARPPIQHLDPAPPTSSFPSGHTGAAVALYVGLAVLLLRVGPSRLPDRARRGLVVVLCLVPVAVGLRRFYRGMHYPSDVVARAIGGGTWLALTLALLGARAPGQRWQSVGRGDRGNERSGRIDGPGGVDGAQRAGRGLAALRNGSDDGFLP
jgi:undecaprenyl-diphosphatase